LQYLDLSTTFSGKVDLCETAAFGLLQLTPSYDLQPGNLLTTTLFTIIGAQISPWSISDLRFHPPFLPLSCMGVATVPERQYVGC